MKVHGKCHCGQIVFQADVDAHEVVVCHCTDCQVLTGSPYRVSVPAKHEAFKLLAGTPKVYIKISEDGTKRAQAFCPNCGTPVYASGVDSQTGYTLRLGCLAERAQLSPHRQIWCRSALGWAWNIGTISPRLEMD